MLIKGEHIGLKPHLEKKKEKENPCGTEASILVGHITTMLMNHVIQWKKWAMVMSIIFGMYHGIMEMYLRHNYSYIY